VRRDDFLDNVKAQSQVLRARRGAHAEPGTGPLRCQGNRRVARRRHFSHIE